MNKIYKSVYANSKRIAWIDNVKFFAIWCVIFGHCNGGLFTRDRIGFEFVNLLIVVFNMPLFMFMSGFSNYNALQKLTNLKSLYVYLFKSLERIALPCIIPCILLYYIRTDLDTINFKLYWFCVMLIAVQVIVSVIFYVVHKFKLHESLGWLVFLGITIMLPQYSICELSPYFLLGGVVKTLQSAGFRMHTSSRTALYILLATGMVGLTIYPLIGKYQFYSYNIHTMLSEGIIHLWLLRFLCACCLICAIIMFVHLISKQYNFISYMGSKSLGLYIWHGVILDAFNRFNYKLPGDASWSWLYITIIICAITVAITVWIWILEQNKITSYLFFGIRQTK